MDTSNSLDLSTKASDFRTEDLLCGDAEEQAQGKRVIGVVEKVIEHLKPLLRYLTIPVATADEAVYAGKRELTQCRALPFNMPSGVYCSGNLGRGELFLTADGTFFISFECCNDSCVEINGKHYHGHLSGDVWVRFPFYLVIERLNSARKFALAKQEERAAINRQRGELLDQIEALFKK